MDTFLLYPIRCATCNNHLAHHEETFQQHLENGEKYGAALDYLGISNYCCRISMMEPAVITFDMEDNALIEGQKSLDAFRGKLPEIKVPSKVSPKSIPLPGSTVKRSLPLKLIPSLKIKETKEEVEIAPEGQPGSDPNLIDLSDFDNGLPLTLSSEEEEPQKAGIPVIITSTVNLETIMVGAEMSTGICRGRKYLAN